MNDPASAPTMAMSSVRLATGALFADRYEVVSLLGEGGMGAVYRVRDCELHEEVALKVLRQDLAEAPGALDRFRREVKLARRVTHPNVARTYDLGSSYGVRFLTMELIEGEPIGRRAGRDRRTALPEVLRILAETARGLAAAHAVGVVHRDLKPDNIMASGERIVITDFGIARLSEAALGKEHATRTLGAAVGTPAYMAPEQLEGREIDGRTDIYALGIVLYELLTGRLPFVGETIYALAVARLTSETPDPRTVDPEIPESVATLTKEMMSRKREDRPDAQTVLGRLDTLRGGGSALVVDGTPKLPGLAIDLTKLAHGSARCVLVAPIDAGDAETVPMANDLTDALCDALCSVRGVQLVSPSAVRRALPAHLQGTALDALSLGRALHADFVIDATLRVSGGKTRLRARMLDVAKGAQTWAERLEGTVDDPFALEDRLSQLVTETVGAHVGQGDGRRGPVDTALREIYHRARAAFERFALPHVREAIEILEDANQKHPHDPWIMSLLGAALIRAWTQTGARDPNILARAEDFSIRALAADSTIGETFLSIAHLRLHQGELRAAVRALQDALSRSPLLGEAHADLGRLLCETGHVEAGMRRLELAHRLDPRQAMTYIERSRTHALLGDREAAERVLVAGEAVCGTLGVILLRLRLVIWWGDREGASKLADQLASQPTGASWERAGPLLRQFAAGVAIPDAVEMFRTLTSPRAAPRHRCMMYEIAAEYFGAMGMREETLAALEEASELPFLDVLWLDRCPSLDGMRGDPRFARVRAVTAARAAELWG